MGLSDSKVPGSMATVKWELLYEFVILYFRVADTYEFVIYSTLIFRAVDKPRSQTCSPIASMTHIDRKTQ